MDQARKIGLITDECIASSAITFLRESWPDEVEELDPALSLENRSSALDQHQGWIRRYDAFAEVADWIVLEVADESNAVLRCEAGWLKPGDKALETRQHEIVAGQALLVSPAGSSERVAQVLRWARSDRLLGIVTSEPVPLPASSGIFLCDAFGCDAAIAARI